MGLRIAGIWANNTQQKHRPLERIYWSMDDNTTDNNNNNNNNNKFGYLEI